MRRTPSVLTLVVCLTVPAWSGAEVVKVEIASRRDVAGGRAFGEAGAYERLVGTVYFAVDPRDPHNRIITDIDKAPVNADGRVEFTADLHIIRPKDGAKASGAALLEVPNRGRRAVSSFNRARGGTGEDADVGDGFAFRLGLTVVSVGWEIDVPAQPGLLRIHVPVATDHGKPIAGIVRADFTPNDRGAASSDSSATTFAVTDLMGYSPADTVAPENTLAIVGADGSAVPIDRTRWSLDVNTVTLKGGFEPGTTYRLSYTAVNPPISGLGLAATRDLVSWLRYAPDSLAPARHAFAFGSSQCGRYLREFLYDGFNSDEKDRKVFDGVMAHIAGAGRIDVNTRWATPTSLAMYAGTSFPFANQAMPDPVSGTHDTMADGAALRSHQGDEGLLDNVRARANAPKVFFTNTAVEYWGGGRAAALIHTWPDGRRDAPLPNGTRAYFLAGTQHGPGAFPPSALGGQQLDNPTDYWYAMRALLVAMDAWVRKNVTPPDSRVPLLADDSLVPVERVSFPSLPGVASPRRLTAGRRVANPLLFGTGRPGTPIPLLVPQVDADGNEFAGVRMPEQRVPLATYTGWNFRNERTGGTDRLVPLMGSYVPFPRSPAERAANKDPRRPIDERYRDRDDYIAKVRAAADALVGERLLVAEDVTAILERARAHWDWTMSR